MLQNIIYMVLPVFIFARYFRSTVSPNAFGKSLIPIVMSHLKLIPELCSGSPYYMAQFVREDKTSTVSFIKYLPLIMYAK